MIIGIIHKGSGLGDQLFSYIATRVRAADSGVGYGFVGKDYFKGRGWMDLDFGKPVQALFETKEGSGKVNILTIDAVKAPEPIVINKPYYDPEFNFIPDGSVIDGYGAQDIRYFKHRLDEIKDWLKVDPIEVPDDLCVINFRGGEYQYVPELYLTKDYWKKAMDLMEGKSFEINTDDLNTALNFFQPGIPIYQNIKSNWLEIRYAKNAIISNSAFAIIPRLLKHLEDPEAVTIAPFGWNARNASLTEWKGRSGNNYPQFTYV